MTIKLCGDEDLEGWLRHRYYGRPSCSSLPEMRSLKRLNICIVKKPTKKKSIGEVSDMQYASEVVYWLLARTRAQVEVKGAVPLHFKTPKQGPKVWLAPEAIDKLIEKNNYIKGKAVRWTSISKIDNNEPALFAEIRSIFRR